MSESVRPAVRGIRRGSCVQIHVELLRGGNSRRIAVAVAVVVGAASGDVFTLGRLCELPDFGERNAAPGGACRVSRKTAAGCGRAGVVDRPVDDVASARASADIFGGDDVAVVFRGDAGAVDAGAESRGRDAVDPGVDVSFLLGQHASALLLVEEDDGMRGKTFLAGGGCGGLRVGVANFLCVGDRFQFRVDAAVEEHEESEAGGFNGGAVAGPGIGVLAGRIVEPVAGVGEGLTQGFQVVVPGVGVAVEAEISGDLCLNLFAPAGEKNYRYKRGCDVVLHMSNITNFGTLERYSSGSLVLC